jgi:hypothetical protein
MVSAGGFAHDRRLNNELLSGSQASRLRFDAMARHYLSAAAQNDKTLSPQQAQQALFELRVRQIELEMEHEELRAAAVALQAIIDSMSSASGG